MPETIPIKKQNGLPPWFGAFTPTERISHAYHEPPGPRGRRRCPPAIAVPAAAQCVLHDPDAELLALGAELETLLRERYIPLARPGAERMAAFNALVDAVTTGNETEEEYLAVRDRIWDQHHKKLSEGDARAEDERIEAAWDGIHNDLYPLVDAILAKPAKTLPGLAVQARAITAAAQDLWEGLQGDNHEYNFICRVCEFLGVIPLHTEVHAGL
jgi:hypothetical protein